MNLHGVPGRLFLLFSCPVVFAKAMDNQAVLNNNVALHDGTAGKKFNTDTVVIRFDYKQSALFHSFTFEVLDSVVNILLKNKAVTFSIDGYAYRDEGSDTICYYLSLNRALFIQTYILGRGVDSSRIISVTGYGKTKVTYQRTDKDGLLVNCRAEISLNYPPPQPGKQKIPDRDEDEIADDTDKCPDVFGYIDNNGCPNTGAVIVPFETQLSNLYSKTYGVLDSVIAVLIGNPALTISIEGHAYKTEGINSVCNQLADERASIVKNYLLSRRIDISRIDTIRSFGNRRPLNAGKTPTEIAANCRAEIVFARK
jgi:outer membrane protein OmpA-like peptidoglycan-associated protein